MPGHALAGSSSPLFMHDADAVASLVMLHHAAHTRSSVVRESMHIVSLGGTQPMDVGHSLSSSPGLSAASTAFCFSSFNPRTLFFQLSRLNLTCREGTGTPC